jgi:hypothetical protein
VTTILTQGGLSAGSSFGFHQGKFELFFQVRYLAQPFHDILNAVDLLGSKFSGAPLAECPCKTKRSCRVGSAASFCFG